MAYRRDLTGQRFGRLIVVERADDYITESGRAVKRWKCKCDCGNEKIIRYGELTRGSTISCGCYHKEMFGALNRTHGLSGNCGRLYPLWKSIKRRCYCEGSKDYKNYGGRGIVMCDEWKDNFQAFHDWAIANGYKEEKTEYGLNILTIDRINVNGNYEPNNCRFITNAEQARNKRNTLTDEERYKTCPICGKTFETDSRTGAKTCSRECGCKLRKIEHQNTKDYTKICPMCGKKFEAKGGHFNQRIYCSNRCKNMSISPVWEFNGEKLHVVEWEEKTGINAHCLLHRKELGWNIERILTTPIRKSANKI